MENEFKNALRGAVGGCSSRAGIDDAFKRYEVSDFSIKCDILKDVMQLPDVFFVKGTPSFEEQFNTLAEVFLSKKWV